MSVSKIQFAQYRSLYTMDSNLSALARAVINNEARYITQFPYCMFDFLHRTSTQAAESRY